MEALWNHNLFKAAVTLTADARNISKEQLFDELAQALNLSSRSVKEFQTPKRRPSSDRAEKLKDIFGIDFYQYDPEASQLLDHLSTKTPQYSHLVRTSILNSAVALLRFIREMDFTEETYAKLRQTLDENALAIPDTISAKLEAFVAENLDPLVFDSDNAFAPCREGTGHEENGVFVVEDTAAFFSAFYSIIMDLEEKFKLLQQELSPLLIR